MLPVAKRVREGIRVVGIMRCGGTRKAFFPRCRRDARSATVEVILRTVGCLAFMSDIASAAAGDWTGQSVMLQAAS